MDKKNDHNNSSEKMPPNKVKQSIYAAQKTQLKKTMHSGFYYEAVFIEYAIIEDRTESVLRHAGGIKLTDSRDQPLKLKDKLNKIRDNARFHSKKIRMLLSLELIDDINSWRDKRNKLVHYLMNTPNDTEQLKELAEQGQELVRILDSKVKSANKIFDKENYHS